ncbi:MAG: ArsA family ATPase [Acidimicrobiales bacterium]
MTNLLDRRLLFVTGKGGTGKSTVACALARTASARGLRTLVCGMDGSDAVPRALGAGGIGYDPVEVAPNLSAMVMRTDRSLQEYVRIHLRLPLMPDISALASTFDFVADAAPGVKEVLGVGKVCWEVRERHFDLVVFDADASGHIVAQIASPRTINSLVPRGPLRDQTAWMLAILDDPAACAVVAVTTAEELPVTETVELVGRLRTGTRTEVAAVVVNSAEPAVPHDAQVLAADPWFASVAPAHARSVRMSVERRLAQTDATGALGALGVPVMELPAVGGDEQQVSEHLARVIADMPA